MQKKRRARLSKKVKSPTPYKRMIKVMAHKELALPTLELKRVWSVYILCCADRTLYTGITNNMSRRIKMHNKGLGAKYTRMRGPVTVVFEQKELTRSQALIREYEIKRYPKLKKEKLITSCKEI